MAPMMAAWCLQATRCSSMDLQPLAEVLAQHLAPQLSLMTLQALAQTVARYGQDCWLKAG